MVIDANPLPAYPSSVYQAMDGAYYGDVHLESAPMAPRLPDQAAYYQQNPMFQDYFSTLPAPVRRQIVQSGVEFSTLGELMQCAEHLLLSFQSSEN